MAFSQQRIQHRRQGIGSRIFLLSGNVGEFRGFQIWRTAIERTGLRCHSAAVGQRFEPPFRSDPSASVGVWNGSAKFAQMDRLGVRLQTNGSSGHRCHQRFSSVGKIVSSHPTLILLWNWKGMTRRSYLSIDLHWLFDGGYGSNRENCFGNNGSDIW